MPKRPRFVGTFRSAKKPKVKKRVSSASTDASPTDPSTPTDSSSFASPAQEVVVKAVTTGEHPELSKLLTESGWLGVLSEEFRCEYFAKLQKFLELEWDDPKTVVYPPVHHIFNAFEMTPYESVRVVLLGQDPYHGINQATGLSFSVPQNARLPSSLRNVYKEIQSDLGYHPGSHGDLTNWATQGVLLMNTVLTVRGSQAYSHRKKGWERFTRKILAILNERRDHLVFFLWGAHAQKMGKELDGDRHLVLKCPHPSGLSAYRGFFGCRHFSKCNTYLESHDLAAIDWHV